MRGGRGASQEAGGPGVWWRHDTSGMHVEKARLKAWGPRARAERTENMPPMFVTLEVSKLSGWLKADACCRVEGRAHAMRGGERCEPGGGRACGVVAAHKRHAPGNGLTQGLGAKGTRGAHLEHVAHGRDAGGIKAQWLVEGRRALPSRREGMRCGGGEVRAGRQEGLYGVVAARHKRHAQGPTQGWGPRGHARSSPRTWSSWS
jgi:hypothetical protein